MGTYKNFDEALKDFRESGGAMIYYGPSSDGPACWEVTDIMSAIEMVGPSHTPRYATELALTMGGMSEGEIQRELEGWQAAE